MAPNPVRIRLSRAKGWRMPPNTVKVDRSTRWGNPFIVGKDGDLAQCVQLHRALMSGVIAKDAKAPVGRQRAALQQVAEHLEQLRSRNLACWCPLDQPCHADVLLELANRRSRGGASRGG